MPSKHAEFLMNLEKASAFSFRSVESRVGNAYAKTLIHNLRGSGRITELMKGWYTFKHSPYLITVPLGEAYAGLGTAAHMHNAWDQIPNIDILTPRAPHKIKAGEKEVAGRKVIIRRLDPRMYFGYDALYLDDAKEWIRVSDPEKTMIDLVYYNYPFTDEIMPGLLKIAEQKKLSEYLKRMRLSRIRGYKKVEKALRRFLNTAPKRKQRVRFSE